ncbi:hypothetical protein [Streptomyces sp. V1I1]|uniref:hypothetical protein n=1 Tax=Streptomyces sp. V1I1 TaxID=3042272 RepID=UPI0027D86D76|nr:hypothetical protein [Streptomyces sp. V1I1]
MSRRVLMPLRAWSGALLVCAVMFCLTGIARPAIAMPPSMTSMGSMEVASPAAADDHSSRVMHADAAGAGVAMAVGSVEHGTHCPMFEKQCAAPQATLVHDVQPGTAVTDVPTVTACSHAAVTARPNAPPPALAPPDLHRLCVSRT